MSEIQTLSQENRASRIELTRLVNGLSIDQLYHEMPAGWNVLAVLAHLAFWDQRAITLINKWQKDGISPSLNDTDVINESTRTFFRELDPERGKTLVLTTAQETDDLINSLPDDFLNEIKEKGTTVHLNRAEHRKMHIAEIKAALGL
jgi:hypothetical protein